MAEALGVSAQFISDIMRGKSPLPLIQAMRIEKITEGKFTLEMLMSKETKELIK